MGGCLGGISTNLLVLRIAPAHRGAYTVNSGQVEPMEWGLSGREAS
jgi:hypothetical protein